MAESEINLEKEKVNLETSLIAWSELQRFFAAGQTIHVARDLDLVEVAYEFSRDNKTLVRDWLEAGKLGRVSDRQAQAWIDASAVVWAVVAKPWVLVQDKDNNCSRPCKE